MRLVDTPVHRRRRRTLAGVAVAAALGGVAIGAAADEDPAPERGSADASAPDRLAPAGADATGRGGAAASAPDPLAPAGADGGGGRAAARLSLERQVGQLVVLRYRGTRPPAYVPRALRAGRAAGAILFRDNVTTPAALRAITRRLHAAARGRGAPLICVDQEGEATRIVPWAGPRRAAGTQAVAGRVGPAATAAGRTLRASGLTVTLAPVADLPTVDGAALSSRAFGRDPAAVQRDVAASVRGWRAAGVAPTLKHFPGIGGARTNTDDGSVTIDRSRRDLELVDLSPFRAGIRAGAPLVMLGHARYPALDRANIASQSPAVLRLLRRELGFRGVAITDSLEAAAVRALSGGPGAAAIRSVAAGVDVILTTGAGSHLRVYRALLARARSSRAFRVRVAEAAGRVVRLRRDVLASR